MQQRLLSLDIFRGLTIAGMILVNNPGSWSTVYPPLLHAPWHGCTPTDWVFPFFLFIVGVAAPLALGRRKDEGASPRAMHGKIFRRVLVIFGLGLLMAAFPHFGITASAGAWRWLHYVLLAVFLLAIFWREVSRSLSSPAAEARRQWLGRVALVAAAGLAVLGWFFYDFSSLRIPGVLQRIALVYGACAMLYLYASVRTQLAVAVGLLLAYWAALTLIPVPGGHPPNLEPTTNLGAWLDNLLLSGHLWSQSKVWDPEGLFSTLPAIASGIAGMLAGEWLRTHRGDYEKVAGLLAVGVLLLGLGAAWGQVFPINKSLWTSSYVVYTSGLALLILGAVYWLVDCKGYRNWARPFVVYGANALFVFVASGLVVKLLHSIQWTAADDTTTNLKGWLYATVFVPIFASPYNASLAFALANVLVFLGLAWLLYRRNIFIRV